MRSGAYPVASGTNLGKPGEMDPLRYTTDNGGAYPLAAAAQQGVWEANMGHSLRGGGGGLILEETQKIAENCGKIAKNCEKMQ